MKCLSCGNNTDKFLCPDCRTADSLDNIFYKLLYYRPDECDNEYINEYSSALDNVNELKNIIPDILNLFDSDIADYYFCVYYKDTKDERFEDFAIAYINNHKLSDILTQRVIYKLLDFYLYHDWYKPCQWCDLIMEHKEFACELKNMAATFFSKVGDYAKTDQLIAEMVELVQSGEISCVYEKNDVREWALKKIADLKKYNELYKNKKPYWPTKEDKQRIIAEIYDAKGIKHPTPGKRAKKVSERDFNKVTEYVGESLTSYCAFWCENAFSLGGVKAIYQIAAVKIENGKIFDKFNSFIRPWDGPDVRKNAAKAAHVSVEDVDNWPKVELVMSQFFEFVGDNVLIAASAMGEQQKLLVRAARYSGMTKIKNELFDLLDYAEDLLLDKDDVVATADDLMNCFRIDFDGDAQAKAIANYLVYEKMKMMEN